MNTKRALTVCGHRHKDKGKEQDRCWICKKPVFEQQQNAKQATESSPAEMGELKTFAGTTEATQTMWPELKPVYGVFTESSDPKNPHGREEKKTRYKLSKQSFWNIWEKDKSNLRCACRQRPLQGWKIKDFEPSFNLAAGVNQHLGGNTKAGVAGCLKPIQSNLSDPQSPLFSVIPDFFISSSSISCGSAITNILFMDLF